MRPLGLQLFIGRPRLADASSLRAGLFESRHMGIQAIYSTASALRPDLRTVGTDPQRDEGRASRTADLIRFGRI